MTTVAVQASTDQARSFLGALFAGANAGLVEIRALPSRARRFILRDDFDALLAALRPHENNFIGVATRKDDRGGTLWNCAELPVVFCDIDFKTVAEADARERLKTFPLPPHFVVHSGGGLHCYWRLREPFVLPSEAEAAKGLLRRIAAFFDGDSASAECARVLRVPGTFNFKYNPPRPVVLEHLEDGWVDPSELGDLLPAEPLPPDVGGGTVPFAVSCTIEAGARNSILYRTARSLKAKGLSPAAIHAAVTAENQVKCKPPLPDAELKALVTHATTQTDRPTFAPLDAAAPSPVRLDPEALDDAPFVAAEGKAIAATGVPYVVEGLVPAFGMLGFIVAFAKTGKTTFGQALGAADATGALFSTGRPARHAS
jgi:hypothetical protein